MKAILEITKLLSDRNALAEKIKESVPPMLDGLFDRIREQAGAKPGDNTAVVFYTGNVGGAPATMASVRRIDQFGTLGEEIGLINLAAAVKAVPNDTIKQLIPF